MRASSEQWPTIARPWRHCCIAIGLLLARPVAGQHGEPSCEQLLDISRQNLEVLAQLTPLRSLLDAAVSRCRSNGDAANLPSEPLSTQPRRVQEATGAFAEGGPQVVSDGVATPAVPTEGFGAEPEAPGDSFGAAPETADESFQAASEAQAVEGAMPEGEAAEPLAEGAEGGEVAEGGEMAEGAEGGEMTEGGEMEEGEEGEEEEFVYSDVDVGVGGMLLGSVAFVMMLFYFVNWQDDDIRRYSWSIISTTVSIFTAVLTFHGVNHALMSFLEKNLALEENGFFLVLISYTCFLLWFAAMQIGIGIETGSFSQYAPANLTQETWVIANAMRWDFGMTIDTKYVRMPEASKSIAVINETELFVMKRQSQKEQMERRTIAVRTLFSHMAGFACIHAGSMMQHMPFFSQSPFMSFMAVVCNRFFLLTVFSLAEGNEHPRKVHMEAHEDAREIGMEDPHAMCADLCKEEVVEAQNDIASLATSYLLVQSMRYSLTGVLPNDEGLEEPPIVVGLNTVLSLYGLGFGCIIVIVFLLHTGLAQRYKQAGVFQNTMGMSLSWCLFWSTRWVATENKTLQAFNMHPETMAGRILLALMLSAMAMAVIFLLDHVEDMAGEDSEMGTVIQNFINSLSILVGFSWEHCFDFSLEAVASKTPNPTNYKVLFTAVVACVITPAWRKYILVKVIQLEQLKVEESKASSKKVPPTPQSMD